MDVRASDRGRSAPDDLVVIFLHIGRTAGATIRRILRRQFRPSEILLIRNRLLDSRGGSSRRLNREQPLEYFAELPESDRARPRLIIAQHISPNPTRTIFGLHRFVPRPSTYVTLLRDPVALMTSQYYYVAGNPKHPLHGEVTGRYPTLDAYVRSDVALETNNTQTRVISGDTSAPFGGCTEQMLEAAKSNIERHFSVVGLTEQFDESLLLLGRAFGWSNLYYVRANVTPQHRRDALSVDTIRLIEQQNRFDAELYRWAAARFEQTIAADRSFGEDLRRFRRRNGLYRLWGHVTYTIPKRLARSWRG